MAKVTIAQNAVVAKLIDPTKEVATFVTNLLSYNVEGGLGWSGKSSFYNVINCTFPAGFVTIVREELQKIGHAVGLVKKPAPPPRGPESPIVDAFGNDDPDYDYQMQALRQVEKHNAGIIRVATGGGKSKIAKLIMARYDRPTLFLTTRGILLYQMKDQLEELKMEIGQVGDGELSFSRGVNLGMVQTLVQALEVPSRDAEMREIIKSLHTAKGKNPNTSRAEILKMADEVVERKNKRRDVILKFLSLIEVVIGEEAHEAGGKSYYEILRYCKNAHIRVALTATPFMRSSAEDNMRLMAAFGPVLIDIPEKLLIDRGILAKPFFRFVDVEAPKGLHKTSPFERAYTLGYIENQNMLDAMLKDALRARDYSLPVLVLVARKKHGDNILESYRSNGLRVEFLRGEDKMEVRQAQLKCLVNGEIDVLIGTNILDVGVDVPAIGLVQRAGGMKAEVQLRQQIGRGLRRKRDMPNFAFIADYSCNANATLRDHAAQREAIVRFTPGFAEGILPPGDDFDWSIFETKMAA